MSRWLVLADEGKWEEAERAIAAIVADDPDMTVYQADPGPRRDRRSGRWSAAAEAYERAALTDDLPQSWLGLAQARLELGAPQADVVDALERAMRVGYQQAAVGYAAGVAVRPLGLTDEADDAYASALVGASGPRRRPGLARRAPRALASTGILAEAIAAPRYRLAGRSRCTRASSISHVTSPRSSPDPSARTSSSTRGAGDPQAVRQLLDLAGSTSRDATLHGWAALVAARAG